MEYIENDVCCNPRCVCVGVLVYCGFMCILYCLLCIFIAFHVYFGLYVTDH